ncbi:hypothetical protein [Parafrankia discariae]|uniref:hypothetical protein n=1 Tax=Parafrankia discariae TaxID=365528 RepID=UPI00036D715E|nr:hypothetical protein [Parafrankia discariae]
MTGLYALAGARSGELLSLGGRVLVHSDRAELEFLFPGARVVACPVADAVGGMPIADHPDMAHVRFPLRRSDFR